MLCKRPHTGKRLQVSSGLQSEVFPRIWTRAEPGFLGQAAGYKHMCTQAGKDRVAEDLTVCLLFTDGGSLSVLAPGSVLPQLATLVNEAAAWLLLAVQSWTRYHSA
jgi:hypothetical protein